MSTPVLDVIGESDAEDDPALALVGREAELESLRDARRRTLQGESSVVIVTGSAGIGKSRLAAELVETDGRHDRLVRITGAEWESDTAFAALEAAELPNGVSLDISAGGGRDDLTPATAASRILEYLRADPGPTLILVDDAQSLDLQTRQTLASMLRRQHDAPVCWVVCSQSPGAELEMLRRAGQRHRIVELNLPGLAPADLREIVSARGHRLSAWAARRLHDHTLGNPHHALLLADALPTDELHVGTHCIPVPARLADPIHEALATASAAVHQVAAAIAVWGDSVALPVLSALTPRVDVAAALDEGIALEILSVRDAPSGTEVRMRHPAIASVVLERLAVSERVELHARTADIEGDRARAMHHRLAAATGRDPALAQAAREIAMECENAGHPITSVDLLLSAAQLFDSAEERAETLYAAVDILTTAGELTWARRVLDEAGPVHDRPSAQRSLARGQVALLLGDLDAAHRALEHAWNEGTDDRTRIRAASLLALVTLTRGDATGVTTWRERAEGLLDDVAGTALEGNARLAIGLVRLWIGDLGAAVQQLSEVTAAVGRDSPLTTAMAQCYLVESLYRQGDWDRAAAVAETAIEALEHGDALHATTMVQITGAAVPSARGDWSLADRLLARSERSLRHSDDFPGLLWLRIGGARLAASRSDHDTVVRLLLPLTEVPVVSRTHEGITPWRTELIESLVAVGRLDEAADVLTDLEASVCDGGAFARCEAARVRGLLADARSDQAAAEAAFDDLAAEDPDAGVFTRSRHALAAGAWLRRRGQRRAARDRLRTAAAAFTMLDAAPWQDRANRELALCGGAGAPASGPLTPAETAVAETVVLGMTNRDVARRLSVSVKTVEAHLSRVFAKLGVSTRTELAARWPTLSDSVTGGGEPGM